ncbi:MAG: hypothetical protein V4577_22040 [Bacteroidota bacterium]
MKKLIILLLLTFVRFNAQACDACKKQQAKLLQGISHGPGPDSNWDYVIVAIMTVVTLFVLVATIKCMLKPAEQNEQHIKRMIFND